MDARCGVAPYAATSDITRTSRPRDCLLRKPLRGVSLSCSPSRCRSMAIVNASAAGSVVAGGVSSVPLAHWTCCGRCRDTDRLTGVFSDLPLAVDNSRLPLLLPPPEKIPWTLLLRRERDPHCGASLEWEAPCLHQEAARQVW